MLGLRKTTLFHRSCFLLGRAKHRQAAPRHVALKSTTAAFSESDNSRHGVFFSVDELPVTGQPANQRNSAETLRAAVAGWRNEYKSLGALTPEQHAQFFDKGWVIVKDVVPKEVVSSAIKDVEGLVDDLAERLHKLGKIEDKYEDAGFEQRLTKIEAQSPHANVLLHKNGVLPKGIQDVWSSPNLIAMAAQLLGESSEICGHPVWNLRCKTPENLSEGQATVPWHQDNAYLDEECWDKLQVTAWVPLVGCFEQSESYRMTLKSQDQLKLTETTTTRVGVGGHKHAERLHASSGGGSQCGRDGKPRLLRRGHVVHGSHSGGARGDAGVR